MWPLQLRCSVQQPGAGMSTYEGPGPSGRSTVAACVLSASVARMVIGPDESRDTHRILLRLFGSADAIARYGAGAGSWTDHWIWHPFVEPPDVGQLIYLSQIAGIGASTVWNYLLNFYWTWAKKAVAPTPSEARS